MKIDSKHHMIWQKIQPYFAPVCAGIVLYSLIGWSSCIERRDIHADTREDVRNVAHSLAHTLIASIESDLKHNMFLPHQLQEFLNTIISTTAVEFVRLESGERAITQAGMPPQGYPESFAGNGMMTVDSKLLWWKSISLPFPMNNVMHSAANNHILILAISMNDFNEQQKADIQRLMYTTAASSLLGLVLLTGWILAIRHRIIRLKLDTAQAKAEQLDDLALAAAGLAHETKNPLGRVRGLAQQISTEVPLSHPAYEKANCIMEEADIASARLGDFIRYASITKPQLDRVELNHVFKRIALLLQADVENAGIQLDIRDCNCTIYADEEMLAQILLNLLLNSIAVTPVDHTISLSCRSEKTNISIVVSDTGSGIAPELLPRIFKPYVTGRPDGHGVGLAVVMRMIEVLQWDIAVESTVGKGSRFTISNIPLFKQEPSRS